MKDLYSKKRKYTLSLYSIKYIRIYEKIKNKQKK